MAQSLDKLQEVQGPEGDPPRHALLEEGSSAYPPTIPLEGAGSSAGQHLAQRDSRLFKGLCCRGLFDCYDSTRAESFMAGGGKFTGSSSQVHVDQMMMTMMPTKKLSPQKLQSPKGQRWNRVQPHP